MTKQYLKSIRQDKGFTLVELLVVVAVVGVLLGIGLLTYNNITESTQQRVLEANLRTTHTLINFAVATGDFESSFDSPSIANTQTVRDDLQQLLDAKNPLNGSSRFIISHTSESGAVSDAAVIVAFTTKEMANFIGNDIKTSFPLNDPKWNGSIVVRIAADGYIIYANHHGQVSGLRTVPAEYRVNINTASAQQLEYLDGVGETIAGRIITERTQNGPFASVEELEPRVNGIGSVIMSRIINQGIAYVR